MSQHTTNEHYGDKSEHYEDKFEFPLLKLIRQRAEEKDISYADAATEVIPEYTKTIRYRDTKFEDAEIGKRQKEMAEAAQREQREMKLKEDKK